MTPRVLSISAVTLATQDMARAVRFYRALGFVQAYGGETAAFTSFRVGQGHVNLIRTAPGSSWSGWGRVIFYVDDVDAMFAHARARLRGPGSRERTVGRALLPPHGSPTVTSCRSPSPCPT